MFVGPPNERVLALVGARKGGGSQQALRLLAQSAEAVGNAPMLNRHFKVVRRLADYGFFRAGAVLVGPHAFLAFGNMLGVRWQDGQRTQDGDFAHVGKAITIALPADIVIDAHVAIESLQMGLLPIEHADRGTGATYLDPRDPDFRIDFLTPPRRGGMTPHLPAPLGIRLQPLKFTEYLLQDVQPAAMFCGLGVAVANVPQPARYALHKLIVAGERPASRIVKSNRDIQQSAALLSLLKERAELQVDEAWQDLLRRGPDWVSRARRGRDALVKQAPKLDAQAWLKLPGKNSLTR